VATFFLDREAHFPGTGSLAQSEKHSIERKGLTDTLVEKAQDLVQIVRCQQTIEHNIEGWAKEAIVHRCTQVYEETGIPLMRES
jgi:hypothetical protein